MSHVKAAGSKAHQGVHIVGKRRGIKKYSGEQVISGNILVRQKGTVIHPGKNTKMGRDFTIFTVIDGFVSFRKMTGHKRGQFYVDVLEQPIETVEKSKSKVSEISDK
ncbi:50S ribosomal protein L27 [Candidatus Dojkabacteria bacterium]|nr:50S ribosomal protein L27 [Candidatus Dojkabacteria bacterium]